MSMESMAMPMQQTWTTQELASLLLMWAIMMVAMMLPSAMPMIHTFIMVKEKRQNASRSGVPTAVFVSGYLVVWTFYSLAATVLQWVLHEQAWLSMQMKSSAPLLSSGILIAVGLYQFTALKQACLNHCRSPLTFLMSEWREGYYGAFKMGLRHGSYCVGCCWSLMLVLFVTGVMNLLAVILIAGFVLGEKILPQAKALSYLSGTMLFAAGSWIFFRTV